VKFSRKWTLLLAGGVGDEDVEVVESNDKLDSAGAGSDEEGEEEDEAMADEEFTGAISHAAACNYIILFQFHGTLIR